MNVSHEWSQQFNLLSSRLTLATDLLGNTYILEPTSSSTPPKNFMLAKYTTDKTLIWQNKLDDPYAITSLSLETDLTQQIYLAGTLGSQLKITCLNASGDQVWQAVEDIAANTAAPKTHLWPQANGDLCLVLYSETDGVTYKRYDQSGEQLESHTWSPDENEEIWALTADSTGHLYATGVQTSRNDKNTTNLQDTWVAKYTKDGTQVWREYWGASTWDVANCLACDYEGNIYLSGTTEGQLGENLARGGADVWLAKYDEHGEELWIKQFGSLVSDQLFHLLCDAAGNIYISGQTAGQIAQAAIQEGIGVWLAKYRPNSDLEWIYQWQSNTLNVADGLSCDALGNVYWAGRSFQNTDYEQSVGWLNKFCDNPETIADLRKITQDQTVSQITNFQQQLTALRNKQ